MPALALDRPFRDISEQWLPLIVVLVNDRTPERRRVMRKKAFRWKRKPFTSDSRGVVCGRADLPLMTLEWSLERVLLVESTAILNDRYYVWKFPVIVPFQISFDSEIQREPQIRINPLSSSKCHNHLISVVLL